MRARSWLPRRCPRCGHDHDWWLADCYCGGGGAAEGYHRAGFGIVGFDNRPQRRYPFTLVTADALTVDLGGFDAAHGSPPCQDHMKRKAPGQLVQGTGWLLAATRQMFVSAGLPWAIENVPGAPMRADVTLCGCTIGLPGFRRLRWFELSHPVEFTRPRCHHPDPVINLARRGWPDRNMRGTSPWSALHRRRPTYAEIAQAMDVTWLRGREVCEAIPPGFTEIIGTMLRAVLEASHETAGR